MRVVYIVPRIFIEGTVAGTLGNRKLGIVLIIVIGFTVVKVFLSKRYSVVPVEIETNPSHGIRN